MTRRGYSKAFPAGKDRASTGYVLQGIPAGLWKRAQAKAKRDGVSMRAVILQLLTDWVASPPAESAVDQIQSAIDAAFRKAGL